MGKIGKLIQPHLVIGATQQGERHVGAIGKSVFQLAQMQGAGIVCRVGDHDNDLARAPGHQIFPEQMAFSFPGTGLAEAEQTTETAIGSPVCRINEHGWKICQIETASHDKPEPDLFCRDMGLHHPGQGVAVTDAQCLTAKSFCLFEQFDRRRGSTQEREIGRDLQFGVAWC